MLLGGQKRRGKGAARLILCGRVLANVLYHEAGERQAEYGGDVHQRTVDLRLAGIQRAQRRGFGRRAGIGQELIAEDALELAARQLPSALEAAA